MFALLLKKIAQECIAFKKHALRHDWNDVGVESKAVGESLIYRINKLLTKKGVKRT